MESQVEREYHARIIPSWFAGQGRDEELTHAIFQWVMERVASFANAFRFGFPVFRTVSPTSRSFLAFALAPWCCWQRRCCPQNRAVAQPPQEFATDPHSLDGSRLQWEVARGAAPYPHVIDAAVSAADPPGPDGWLTAGILLRRTLGASCPALLEWTMQSGPTRMRLRGFLAS